MSLRMGGPAARRWGYIKGVWSPPLIRRGLRPGALAPVDPDRGAEPPQSDLLALPGLAQKLALLEARKGRI